MDPRRPRGSAGNGGPGAKVVFDVLVPDDFDGELNGRALLLLSDNADERAPYTQWFTWGGPVFGQGAFGLKAGDIIRFSSDDAAIVGYPFDLGDIPPEEIYVQAYFAVYTRYERADGHVVWGMEDHGRQGPWVSNPFNLYSEPVLVDFSAESVSMQLTWTNLSNPITNFSPGK